jgi:hypothetical protein
VFGSVVQVCLAVTDKRKDQKHDPNLRGSGLLEVEACEVLFAGNYMTE